MHYLQSTSRTPTTVQNCPNQISWHESCVQICPNTSNQFDYVHFVHMKHNPRCGYVRFGATIHIDLFITIIDECQCVLQSRWQFEYVCNGINVWKPRTTSTMLMSNGTTSAVDAAATTHKWTIVKVFGTVTCCVCRRVDFPVIRFFQFCSLLNSFVCVQVPLTRMWINFITVRKEEENFHSGYP